MNYQMLDEFFQGHSTHAYELFGAHVADNGVTFTVYAPEARSVQVEGDFNGWDGNRNWLTKIDYRGVWEGFVPEAREYQLYKLLIETKDGQWVEKADPYGRYGELRPRFSSIIVDGFKFPWTDKRWCNHRSLNYDKPVNIYEVHAGGWKKDQFGNWYTYNQLTKELIPYVKEKGYTHIEFMPLMNHPFDGSWGYQIAGFYALTSKYGTVYEFQNFVNEAHKAGIGVIMDFVAVHFASDSYGLCAFDGSKVYEYQNENEKSQWGSFNFDLGKDPVRSFLMSAANYWVNQYHLDGLRMDAVSNMIFWDGNKNRGENNGALEFIRRFNGKLAYEHPGLMLIAEDSSDYPKVTADTADGGLGFHYKWDLGWMNDTLSYYKKDPIFRKYHHNALTFSMMYYWSERFMLPLSHDEVVHGKGTIINKMWGLYGEKFAQCKNLYTYMMTHPGKKLNFMGNEIGHFREFDEMKQLDWFLLDYPTHQTFERAITDLHRIYLAHPAFWKYDYDLKGFHWINADDASASVYSYYREDEHDCFVVLLNMTPNGYEQFSIGVPYKGTYEEIFNSEKSIYGGQDMVNYTPVTSFEGSYREFKQMITVRLAPFAGIIFHVKKPRVRKHKTEE
ncbi:MAG: 1,4-alpha-glucan branching protein GlgB [Erysipelotrichales bacterium]|nr:1,4-alpha-glucan branching protein GlgB [Erysipelotrichales bacterium]